MNKKIKRIIALALIFTALSQVEPTKYFNLITTQAYASDDSAGISSLKVCEDGGSSSIRMYENSNYSTPTKFDEDTAKYYIKLTREISGFNVRASVDSGYSVKIIDTSDDDDDEYNIEDEISIKKGKTKTIKVEVTDNSDSSKKTFSLKVYRENEDGNINEDDEEDIYDDIYLKDITLSNSGNNIKLNFNPNTSIYNINVDKNIDRVKIEVNPDDDGDKIRIAGTTVDEDDDYKKIVTLKEGKNEIEIIVKNEDDERIYTININRGESSIPTNIIKNKWVMVNGKWQYNDSNGNLAKNMWIQNYFVQADGNMATGWLNYNGIWFYLGNDGAKKMGWQFVNSKWYYLDTTEGKMVTGWIRDINDGKYYYLNSDGSMAFNTTINGYKLGSSGAWIK